MKNINLSEFLFNIILAALGGIVNRMTDEKRDKKVPKKSKYLSSAIVSSFVGVVVYFLCLHVEAPAYLTTSITAISGFVGTPVINVVYKTILLLATKKFNIEIKDVEKSKDKHREDGE